MKGEPNGGRRVDYRRVDQGRVGEGWMFMKSEGWAKDRPPKGWML